MRWRVLIFAALFLCGQVHAVEIAEFCPDTYLNGEGDEYFILKGDSSLEDVTIGDGEGSIRFPPGSYLRGAVVVAREARSFEVVHHYLPDFELFDTSTAVPDVIRTGDLRLANLEDELTLLINGIPVQHIAWPEDVTCREGQVHFQQDGVWDPRPLLIGQSRFEPMVFENVTVTAFVSPDCSSEVLREALSGARKSVQVSIYEFTDPSIAALLANVSRVGVDVSVLMEGGPVGGIPPEEYGVVDLLTGSGIQVYQMTTTDLCHARYRFTHAKYCIIDDDHVFITSENFKPGGFPQAGGSGNRGWGAYLENEFLAAYFQEVFQADLSGDDIIPFDVRPGGMDTVTYGLYEVEFTPCTFSGATVTPVISPDTSDLIYEMINDAKTSIDIEQAYISNWSHERINPYISAALNASKRGVRVRVLLDSYWYNVEEEEDNDEMAAFLNAYAKREGLALEARCADLDGSNLLKIHNKGMIVDGEQVLISSINWNENSPSFNREAGVIIRHPGVGDYYTRVFEDDWNASTTQKFENSGFLRLAASVLVVLVLILLYISRRRR
jgi:cardiolipin synthase